MMMLLNPFSSLQQLTNLLCLQLLWIGWLTFGICIRIQKESSQIEAPCCKDTCSSQTIDGISLLANINHIQKLDLMFKKISCMQWELKETRTRLIKNWETTRGIKSRALSQISHRQVCNSLDTHRKRPTKWVSTCLNTEIRALQIFKNLQLIWWVSIKLPNLLPVMLFMMTQAVANKLKKFITSWTKQKKW